MKAAKQTLKAFEKSDKGERKAAIKSCRSGHSDVDDDTQEDESEDSASHS